MKALNPQMSQNTEARPKYKLGVALSGGGARGFAHAGALKAIEEAGLKPDVIAGVSAGAIIAILYAAGKTPVQMLEAFDDASLADFVRLSIGRGAIFNIDKIKRFIAKQIKPYERLEDLPLPTYIGVTDFDNGEPAYFNTGAAPERVLASCSIPIIFPPIAIEGKYYVDGGLLRNLPAWIIRPHCETLIGINCSPLKSYSRRMSILETAFQTINLVAKTNQKVDMELCDLAISTNEISLYQIFNLKQKEKVFNAGYINTRKALRDAGLWHPNKSTNQ